FHLLRFHPNYELTDIPSTPVGTLEEAWKRAREAELNYVYLGNLPGHRYEDTTCPNCNALLIKRFSFEILRWRLTQDLRCPECGQSIAIKGRFHASGFSHPYTLI
ncbi:MAG: AmmeMemoRadiSam system radical SAM enzyme, partial [Candidatus Bathyarchaeia archaeon]